MKISGETNRSRYFNNKQRERVIIHQRYRTQAYQPFEPRETATSMGVLLP
jgi:hypothetical protein